MALLYNNLLSQAINVSDYYGFTTTADTTWSSDTIRIKYGAGQCLRLPQEASPPKPDSALDWLDRRVDEMRVQL